jgi:hypothetical protein
MSSHPPTAQRTRPRFGVLGLLFLLCFLAGLAVAAYAVRRFGWFVPAPAPVVVAQPAAVPAQLPPTLRSDHRLDLATLTAREAELAGRLAALEQRTAAVTLDAANAGTQAGRAEALLVAASARRALDRGMGLGALENQLRARLGPVAPVDVEQVIESARAPLTLEDLRLGLDAVAPDLQSGGDGDWWRTLRRELGSLVVLRRAGTPRALPAERLARVRRLLDGGQVEAAVAEAQGLPGAPRAANWMDAARRYATARRALDALDAAALMLSAPKPGPLSAPLP